MKSFLASDISDLVKDFIHNHYDESEKYTKNYIGIVLDNQDPERVGRCKIRVHGLHDDLSPDDLPWATPEFPLSVGIRGSFIVPEVGTVIYVKFDDGDLYNPIYCAKVADERNMNFEADKDEDYPDSVIFYETKNGDYFKINRNRGEFTIKTGAGVLMKFNQNGDIALTNTSSENGDARIILKGDFLLDNRLGNINVITQTHSTSAFSDVVLNSNGGIEYNCLDNIKLSTNREVDINSGDRVVVKSRSGIRTETLEHKQLANTIELLPSTSELETVDVNNFPSIIPPEFKISIGSNLLKVPFMTIKPEPLGGPFNCLLFDPFTGQPHQGRIATGVINPLGFISDDVGKTAEIAKMKANVVAKYSKLLTYSLNEIAKKYASIDSQAQMIIAGLTGNTLLLDQKAKEIEDVTKQLASMEKEELDKIDSEYGTFLTKPIFGTILEGYENNRVVYKEALTAAKPIAALDVTGKTNPKDIAGPGNGLIGE